MLSIRFTSALFALILGFGAAACGGDAPAPATAPEPGAAPPSAGAASADVAASPPGASPPSPITATPSSTPAATAAPAKRDVKENPILGRLSEGDVQERILKNYALFDPCLPESYKKKNTTIKVQLRPTIGPSGVVNEVKIAKSSGDAKFDSCVAAAFKKIEFPKSSESAFVTPTWVELGGGTMSPQ